MNNLEHEGTEAITRRGSGDTTAVRRCFFSVSVVIALTAIIAGAADDPQEAMRGGVTVVKVNKKGLGLVKFVAKPPQDLRFSLPTEPGNDPTIQGGKLRVSDSAAAAGAEIYLLRPRSALAKPLGWKALGPDAQRRRGFRYRGQGSCMDPCKFVLVKPKVVEGTLQRDRCKLAATLRRAGCDRSRDRR